MSPNIIITGTLIDEDWTVKVEINSAEQNRVSLADMVNVLTCALASAWNNHPDDSPRQGSAEEYCRHVNERLKWQFAEGGGYPSVLM